jgi:glycerol-3-phosphate dehydrogenase
VDYCGAPEAVTACADEISYLCDAVNRQLRCSLSAADVVYSYAGVRSLVSDAQDNPAAVTRDYVLDLAQLPSHTDAAAVPLLTVLGGKITTFRRLAEQAVEMLRPVFPQMGPAWTARTPLPGGEHHGADAAGTQAHLLTQAHFLPAEHALGLFSRHGSRAGRVLAGARTAEELGRHFGAGLYEAEARHFIANEWAMSTEDVLWRRSKFGLRLDTEQLAQFARWMDSAV